MQNIITTCEFDPEPADRVRFTETTSRQWSRRERVHPRTSKPEAPLDERQIESLLHALEEDGAIFVSEDHDGGLGVRLMSTTKDMRAIARLGGSAVGDGDVWATGSASMTPLGLVLAALLWCAATSGGIDGDRSFTF